jgi:hypothetical protein
MQLQVKKKIGRPLKYKTQEELESAIDTYFETLAKERRIATITGLALELGIAENSYWSMREEQNVYRLPLAFVGIEPTNLTQLM